ncbi:hypothetical protein [Burkholderia oklahomensis]|uniref:Uncharacterized protein n=1 Tax=Burkholderia oklahomensis TaxID=342113 RepID=A0AAI8BCQ6_9BURK|nr:hypothetical protein [Burkholderia oklahomensis]AIO70443.1 hypothetical protein DM82_4336 [Burkholderia oklahomensis]AOI40119.1 hypothetical protein WG70_11185 [Burkholderia oklahomensis EO147]KUY68323.1 hypothetical protein WG70_24975 [Burkholderia oklahomensis EO147]QPS39511.1 hypothetical protein I6G57_27110 [Burkholderia oklahomensis]
MTKLTYTTKTALIAAYRSGVKFEIVNSNGDRFPVTSMRSEVGLSTVAVTTERGSAYYGVQPDGTFESIHMQTVRLQHAASAVAEIYPLPFKTLQEVKEAFDAGTQFVVKHGEKREGRVVLIAPHASWSRVVVEGALGSGYHCFRPNGENAALADAKLVVRGEIKRSVKPAVLAAVPAVPAKTFLEQFIGGSEFHTPHTRETVVDVKFVRGHNRMDVTLRDEAGKERVTPRYNLDGTHKFRPERNLVAGKLPPKMVERKVTIYRHAYNGTLFVIREGEVIPSIRGISNATKVGETTITEQQ